MAQYLDNWNVVKTNNKSGGQGTISLVEKIADNSIKGALKQMHPQQQQIQLKRERMSREIQSLEKVAGNGIPKIYEHNLNDISNSEVSLYFISEWIDGKTLHDVFLNKPTNLENAIRITRELCLIVDRCHQVDVLHRDIKPQNILISESGAIYLVDFGLAWIEPISESENKFNSLPHEEMSNYFLRLDELITGYEKHNKVSDITYLVGLFFFLLSGQYPKSLTDGHGNPPQTTLKHKFPKGITEDKKWFLINRIFTVGFQSSINHRIQSAIDLISMLDKITHFEENNSLPMESNPKVQKLQEILSSNSLLTKTNILLSFHQITSDLMNKFKELSENVNLEVTCNYPQGQNFRAVKIWFGNKNHSDKKVELLYKLELRDEAGTKMIATYSFDDHPKFLHEGYASNIEEIKEVTLKFATDQFPEIAERYTSISRRPPSLF